MAKTENVDQDSTTEESATTTEEGADRADDGEGTAARDEESDTEDAVSEDHRESSEDHAGGDHAAGEDRDGARSQESAVPPVPPGGEEPATTNARRAHLTLSRVEPWSVMKFSFVMSLVCFIILFVAVAVIYAILSSLGVFDAIVDLINSLTDGGDGEDLGLRPDVWFSPARVLGYTGVIGALNIVLITALATVGAMLYNLVADLIGGLDVTLSESE